MKRARARIRMVHNGGSIRSLFVKHCNLASSCSRGFPSARASLNCLLLTEDRSTRDRGQRTRHSRLLVVEKRQPVFSLSSLCVRPQCAHQSHAFRMTKLRSVCVTAHSTRPHQPRVQKSGPDSCHENLVPLVDKFEAEFGTEKLEVILYETAITRRRLSALVHSLCCIVKLFRARGSLFRFVLKLTPIWCP